MVTYIQQAVANRLWRSYVLFLDYGGRKTLPFYGIRENHRANIAKANADKLWQEYVDELH